MKSKNEVEMSRNYSLLHIVCGVTLFNTLALCAIACTAVFTYQDLRAEIELLKQRPEHKVSRCSLGSFRSLIHLYIFYVKCQQQFVISYLLHDANFFFV